MGVSWRVRLVGGLIPYRKVAISDGFGFGGEDFLEFRFGCVGLGLGHVRRLQC